MNSLTQQKSLTWMIIIIFFVAAFYLISDVLTPFFVSIFIAYLANPAISRMEAAGVPRWVSMLIGIVALTFIVASILLLLLPTLQSQLASFADKLPEYISHAKQWMTTLVMRIKEFSGNTEDSQNGGSVVLNAISPESIPVSGEAAAATVEAVKASAITLLKSVTNIFLVPVIAFYLLRDWNTITEKVTSLIPEGYRKRIINIGTQADEVLKSFLHGQFLVMCALAILYSAGLFLIGLDFSLLIGVIAGALSFVPFLGTGIGLIIACIVSIMQSDQWLDVWKVLVVFSIGQFIEGNLLTPKLVGEKINLHPVIVIFAVLAGGELFGFVGILLALPVAAVAWVVIKDVAKNSQPSE